MDNTSLWQRYQDWLYYDEELNFYLDVSRMRFDKKFVKSLEAKFVKAFQDMQALEAGAIANVDENRMVGHYWLRNPDIAPNKAIKQAIIQDLIDIENFVAQIHSAAITPPGEAKFTDILSIGIGGSALGPQFVADALAPVNPPLNIHFLDNTDPAGMDKVFAQISDRLRTTLVVVISKSGSTPETRNGLIETKNLYKAQKLNFSSYAVAITGIGSKLDQIAQAEGWLATFPMYDWVGGRTSEFSAVGLLDAALQGIDIRAMLAGAKAMDNLTRKPEIKTNPAALLALSWYYAGDGKGLKDMVILPYKDSLLLFSRYLQQLVMESLGKEKDLDGNKVYQGLTVYGNKGSTDQHAYVQQLREGIPNFFATFVEVLHDRQGVSLQIEGNATSGDFLSGFLLGTRQALYENRRDSITVTIPRVDAFNVGVLIALYERAVGLYASLININAYHQPGVEAGKKAAAAILALQEQIITTLEQNNATFLSLSALADKIQAGDRIETIYQILRHLHANQRGVVLEGNLGKPATLRIGWRK